MIRSTPARTSLIIASYNQPRALALVLAAIARQTRQVDEIIIADDGSKAPTFEVIERARQELSLPIATVITQADAGFRKTVALNRGILKSTGQQLLFLDGDVIPPPHWAERHIAAYQPMSYAVGTYMRLDLATSKEIAAGGIEQLSWAVFNRRAKRDRTLIMRSLKAQFYILRRKPDRPKVWGGNLSVDRGLLFAVNGFDERYCGYSGEDSDLRNRMNNYGGQTVSLFFSTMGLHLHHGLDREEAASGHNLFRNPTGMSVYQASKKNLWAVEGLTTRRCEDLSLSNRQRPGLDLRGVSQAD